MWHFNDLFMFFLYFFGNFDTRGPKSKIRCELAGGYCSLNSISPVPASIFSTIARDSSWYPMFLIIRPPG